MASAFSWFWCFIFPYVSRPSDVLIVSEPVARVPGVGLDDRLGVLRDISQIRISVIFSMSIIVKYTSWKTYPPCLLWCAAGCGRFDFGNEGMFQIHRSRRYVE